MPHGCGVRPLGFPVTLPRAPPFPRPHPHRQVYTISGGKAVPSWLSEKKKRALRKDEEYNRRCGRGVWGLDGWSSRSQARMAPRLGSPAARCKALMGASSTVPDATVPLPPELQR